ncbi:MAG: glycosyltransferase family 39 protein [bacterium]|nr:glycosyltransferase family 39 protein [bacterium]
MLLSSRNLTVAILVIAFCLRLAAAYAWHQSNTNPETPFRLGDSHSYWTLAEQIGSGQPYQYGSENARIFRAPLLPIFLAPFTWIADVNLAVFIARIACCLLGSLAVWLVMKLAEQAAGKCAALACGVLAALHPGAIGMSIVILSEALFIPLMVGHLLCWQKSLASDGRPFRNNSLMMGLLAGLAVLTRPSWLLFLPFSAAVGMTFGPLRGKQFRIALLAMLAFCITMSPWWLRNAAITGRFVPTTLQVGLSLYDGLHPGATGASDTGMEFAQRLQAEQLVADAGAPTAPESTLEYRVDQRAKSAALRWARENPLEVVRLAARKFVRTWSLWPDGGEAGSNSIRIALGLGTVTILVLAVYGTYRLPDIQASLANDKQPMAAAIRWMPCIYFTLLHMLFVGSVRYREPGVFILCTLAGAAIACLANCYSRPAEHLTQIADSVKERAAER